VNWWEIALTGLGVWLILAVALGVTIGRVIRLADSDVDYGTADEHNTVTNCACRHRLNSVSHPAIHPDGGQIGRFASAKVRFRILTWEQGDTPASSGDPGRHPGQDPTATADLPRDAGGVNRPSTPF
jgi:hypothetical protein